MERINWQHHISAQKESGVTIKEYCSRYGISGKSFSFHKSHLKKQAILPSRERFAEVITHDQQHQSSIRVELPGGIVLSVVGKEALKEVLSAVGFINQ